MAALDPYEGAKTERQDANRALLESVAQAGAAGKKAYQDARAAAGQQRQSALDRAAQRQQITGQSYGGADLEPVMQESDRFNTYFGGQEAAGQQHLQNIGASGTSYLSKVGAIAPFMQQKALQQAAELENQYKTQIAATQAQLDAEKAAEERAHQRDIELLKLKAQLSGGGSGGGGSSSSSAASGGRSITSKELKSSVSPAAQRLLPTGKKLDNMIANISLDTGNIIHEALPGTENKFLPPPITKDWITQNVIMPGTTKKATGSRADDVLRAPEVGLAQEFLKDLGIAKRDAFGKVDDSDFGSRFKGMTPYEAFADWIDSQPGIRTMKEALKQYYRPYLESQGR